MELVKRSLQQGGRLQQQDCVGILHLYKEKLNKVYFQVQILTIPDRRASLASGDKPQAIRTQEFTINCNDKYY